MRRASVILGFVMTAVLLHLTTVLAQAQPEPGTPGAIKAPAPNAPLPEMLAWAQTVRILNNGDLAVQLFREIAQRRDESAEVAARAQYDLGECLMADFRNPAAAAPELRRVIDEYGEFPELVNSARVRLAELHALAGEYDAALPFADAVVVDGQAGRAGQPLLAWALFYRGQVFLELSGWAETERMQRTTLENRQAAAEQFAQATVVNSDGGREAIKKLVDLLCCRHYYWGVEQEANPRWMVESRVALALALLPYPAVLQADGTPDPFVSQRSAHLLRLAQDAESRKDFDGAIAWHRLNVAGKNTIGSPDWVSASAIGDILEKTERTDLAGQWWRYTLDPTGCEDPTVALVSGKLGVSPEHVLTGGDVNMSSRAKALGLVYARQGRRDEAEVMFNQALGAAALPRERAEAFSGLAELYSARAQQLDRQHLLTEAQNALQAADGYARDAAGDWLATLDSASSGDRHYAMEQAVCAYRSPTLRAEAVMLADQILVRLAQQQEREPCDWAFAHYMRLQALAWNGRNAEAVELARWINSSFAESTDGSVKRIRALSLLRAARYAMMAQDTGTTLALCGQLEQEHPGVHREMIKWYRDNIGQAPPN